LHRDTSQKTDLYDLAEAVVWQLPH